MVSNLSKPPRVLCEHCYLSLPEIRASSLTLSEIDGSKREPEKGAASSRLVQG